MDAPKKKKSLFEIIVLLMKLGFVVLFLGYFYSNWAFQNSNHSEYKLNGYPDGTEVAQVDIEYIESGKTLTFTNQEAVTSLVNFNGNEFECTPNYYFNNDEEPTINITYILYNDTQILISLNNDVVWWNGIPYETKEYNLIAHINDHIDWVVSEYEDN